MNAIPGLPLAASALFVLLAVLAWVGLPESRQRSAYWKLALLAAAWALLSALFWQQVPALQQIWFAALLLLAWGGWRLIAAVCQVELRRRWLLWLGRMLLGGVLLWLLLLQPAVLSPLEGPMQWQDGLPLRVLSGVLLGLIALSFGEWLLAVLVQQERAHVAPWVFVWLLLSWGLVLDLLAGTSLFAGEVPPLGALPVALALVLGLWLNHRRSGPFPLHGELPRAAFAQTTDPVLLVDGAQRIQAASPAALDVLGRSAALVIGRRLQAVLPEVPAESSAWDGPLWLEDPSRPDGGLWLQAADMQGDRRGAVARLLHVRSGLVWPAPLPLNAGPQRAASRWIHGPSVRPALESVLRRYGLGRQGLAAALHVDYDWARVQQEHGESLLEPLLQGIAERLQQVCDWPVDCFRLPQGQFLLLLTDLTGGEELQTLVQRAESLCAEPFNVGGRRWTLRLRLAAAPDLRLYHTVDEWLADADAALVESRGQCVSTRPQAERRGRLILALEQALLHDGLDWEFEPVLNLTTQQISAWRVHPRWDPEPDVSWRGPRLREAVAHLHM
ncbi:MAG: diguanylate cyclase domain-containing protein, partial [Oceanococcaceae bacterium]